MENEINEFANNYTSFKLTTNINKVLWNPQIEAKNITFLKGKIFLYIKTYVKNTGQQSKIVTP